MGRVLGRCYEGVIVEHLRSERQMVFLSGPRQVGKTVTSRAAALQAGAMHYFNWDSVTDRALLLRGPEALAGKMQLDRLQHPTPVCVLDEIHKAPRWKNLLKGIFDTLSDRMRIVVTGSSRLDIFRRGGDSLMGRYFPYRMHPLSLGELTHPERREAELIVGLVPRVRGGAAIREPRGLCTSEVRPLMERCRPRDLRPCLHS